MLGGCRSAAEAGKPAGEVTEMGEERREGQNRVEMGQKREAAGGGGLGGNGTYWIPIPSVGILLATFLSSD